VNGQPKAGKRASPLQFPRISVGDGEFLKGAAENHLAGLDRNAFPQPQPPPWKEALDVDLTLGRIAQVDFPSPVSLSRHPEAPVQAKVNGARLDLIHGGKRPSSLVGFKVHEGKQGVEVSVR
jgi:hypothetical protein